jgi:hypothetical protein
MGDPPQNLPEGPGEEKNPTFAAGIFMRYFVHIVLYIPKKFWF